MELSKYLSQYSYHAKLQRLFYIATNYEHCFTDAASLLFRTLLETRNVTFFRKCVATNAELMIYKQNNPDISAEVDNWLKNSEEETSLWLRDSENEVSRAKNTTIKDSIRIAMWNMADKHAQIGLLEEAQKQLLRMREYCSTTKQHCDMYWKLIEISVNLHQVSNIQSYANKLKSIAVESSYIYRAHAALAISALLEKNFKSAATHLLEIKGDLNEDQLLINSGEVIISHDIAHYAMFCALATFSRAELKKLLFENNAFISTFLEDDAILKGFLHSVKSGEYSAAREVLATLSEKLSLDLYLGKHALQLADMIFNQLLVFYLSPFQSLYLGSLAAAFQLSESEARARLLQLISVNAVNFKLDERDLSLRRDEHNLEVELLGRLARAIRDQKRSLGHNLFLLSALKSGIFQEHFQEADTAVSSASAVAERRGLGAGAGQQQPSWQENIFEREDAEEDREVVEGVHRSRVMSNNVHESEEEVEGEDEEVAMEVTHPSDSVTATQSDSVDMMDERVANTSSNYVSHNSNDSSS